MNEYTSGAVNTESIGKNDGPSWFDSMEQCSIATGIPKSHLRQAKKLGAPGFQRQRVVWKELKPWYELHKAELSIAVADDSLTKAKTRKTTAEADMAEMERDKMKERFVDMEDAKAFYKQFGAAL